jgi:hypothetical protein
MSGWCDTSSLDCENAAMENPAPQRNSIAGGLVVLVLRGLLLWLVVPIAVIAWPVVRARQRKSGVSLGQYLGWIDLNLVACPSGSGRRFWCVIRLRGRRGQTSPE